MSSPSCISRCNTVSLVPFTPESSRSDQLLTEETELPHKEFKEMLQARSKLNKELDFVYCLYFFLITIFLSISIFFPIYKFTKLL
jgi:hypothetical protein